MIAYALFLLNTLTIVKLQHVAIPRIPRLAECRQIDLHRIQEYFTKTTVVRNQNTEVQYCASMKGGSTNLSHTTIDLDTVIELYSTLEYVNSFKYVEPRGPVTHDGFLSINSDEHLPLYQIAKIQRKHLSRLNSHPGFQDDVDAQLKLMGLRSTDIRGYLLAHSLGGIPSEMNVIPMALNLYWHLDIETEYSDLRRPLASWRSNEHWIRRFLLSNPKGHVAWKIALQYEDNVFVKPKQSHNYRPLSFSLHYAAYTDQHNNRSLKYESPKLTFLNENQFSCKSGVQRRHKEDDFAHHASKCGLNNVKIKNNRDKWPSSSLTAFSYVMQGETYFYANDHNFTWSIHRILRGGEMGEETDSGIWMYHYDSSFTYFMNGKQYMFVSDSSTALIRIRELLPFGKMGKLTYDSKFYVPIINTVSFKFRNEQYFFYQSVSYYCIGKLNDGRLIGSMPLGERHNKKVFFPCTLNKELMLFSYSPEMGHWSIEGFDIIGNKDIMYSYLITRYQGVWETGYDVVFLYTSGERQFIYGLRTKPPYPWMIRELQQNGTLTEKLRLNNGDGKYHLALPLTINGSQYIYKENKDTHEWTINELLYNVQNK